MSGMKKFYGLGLLALLTTAYLTSSCSRDEFSGSIIEAKKQAFSSNFKDAYGYINPQQDWGFGSASTRAFTRAAADGFPDAPTFSSKTTITKPTKPTTTKTFYDTFQAAKIALGESNIRYAKDITDPNDWNSISNAPIVIDVDNVSIGSNSQGLTLLVTESVTFDGVVSSNGGGCVICVTDGKTLTLGAVPGNATIYLSPTAQLILNDATFSGASLFMSANSQVSGEDILVEYGSIVNNGGSFTAANLQLDNSSNFWNENSKKSPDFLDSSPISFIFAQIINCNY